MDRLSAPQQNRMLGGIADLLRKIEQDSGPEFLPNGLDVMGLVRQLALPSAETVEKLSYGDPLFRMPTQSNIPITTDKGYLAEVFGMAPVVPAASRATTRISNEVADQLVKAITRNPEATAPGALQAAGEMAPLARIFAPQQAKSVMPETKALDESGNPVMVYHGTTQAKDLEKAGKFGSWRSAWFTDNPVVAKTYAAGRQEFGSHRGRAIYPSYLDMKNPFVVDARGNSWRSVPAVLPNEGGDELYYTTDKLAKFARQNGYDGLIVKNVFDPGSGRMPTTDAGDLKLTGTTYVVFDPEKQVKSAVSDPAFAGLLEPQAGGKASPSYGMEHRPMAEAGGASRLHEAYKSFGEDVYGKNALQYFGSGDPREAGVVRLIKSIRDNPDKEVTIYRGVPEGANKEINPGDWITLDKDVAEEYGNVVSKKVKAKDITTWPDSLLEFGYFPE